MAYDFLLKGIASLRDAGLRRNYLNKVAINREIVRAWVKENVRRKLPKEQLYAHLISESNLREPFQRLAKISLELNTLHSEQEIQNFLVEEATELSGGERVMLILERDGTQQVAESLFPRGEDSGRVLASILKHLHHARITRTAQLIVPNRKSPISNQKSKILAPLIAQSQLLGYLYVELSTIYGAFDETDRDMLGMLANQAAVSLDNAGLLERLERKVQERTEELNARVDELAILHSVGEAMARTLDVKTVTKIVGDKVQAIFAAEGVTIRLYDSHTNLIQRMYDYVL